MKSELGILAFICNVTRKISLPLLMRENFFPASFKTSVQSFDEQMICKQLWRHSCLRSLPVLHTFIHLNCYLPYIFIFSDCNIIWNYVT